jgi:CRP/FNR family transcriptional regulator, cyclic AMP receptor protein
MSESPLIAATTDPFARFTALGEATAFSERLWEVSEHTQLFEEFSREEMAQIGPHMRVYKVAANEPIINEGETGDYLVVLLHGMVDVIKKDREGHVKRIAVVVAGQSLGEMSMIDGEPRFASCVALEETTFAVLTRPELQSILNSAPKLAAKILLKLMFLLAGRLRQTSAKLVNLIEGDPTPRPPRVEPER